MHLASYAYLPNYLLTYLPPNLPTYNAHRLVCSPCIDTYIHTYIAHLHNYTDL